MPSVTSLGANVFLNTNIQSVSLDSATSIPADAFNGVTSLATVNMPSVQTIGASAFQNTALSGEYTLSSVTSIGANAFTGTSITSVSVPENATLADDIGVSYTLICDDGLFVRWSSGASHGLANTCLDVVELQDVQDAAMANYETTGECIVDVLV